MDFSGIRVLIVDGYARQSLPMIRAFRKLGCEVTAICNSKLDVAYCSRYTSHKILGFCHMSDPEKSTECIRETLKTDKYDIVVPLVDSSAHILAKNKEEFTKYAKVMSNDIDVYNIAGDKLNTMRVCMENDIPCPVTLTEIEEITEENFSNAKYPMVVKPRVGYGAIGFKVVNSFEELTKLFKNIENPKNYIFQEYIPQTDIQYECAMFVDDNNEVKTSLVFSKNRWFPVNGGSSTLNITVERPDIVENCSKLLKKINWRGAADIDLIQDPRDNTAKIMEINPRVSGSVKICFDSGVDQARQMLELAFNKEVTEFQRYELGNRLRCSQTDLLWFLKSPNRFKSNPSWFSIYKTRDQIFTLSDPLPWFAFSLHGVLDYRKEMKKRQ